MRKNDMFFYLSRFFMTILICTTFITLISFLILKPKLIVKETNNLNKLNIKPNNIKVNNNKKDIKVKVYISKSKKIEEMNIEEYVTGVVSAEMPAEFHIEALKAQAVAARTYALAHIESQGGQKCSNVNGADLCDTVHCQVFMHKEERMKSWPESKKEEYWSKIKEAVDNTSSEVIKYKGNIIKEPYYFAVSSGKTENVEDVFSESVPYLKSVKSSGEEVAPKYKTSVTYSCESLTNIINGYYPKSISKANNLKANIKIKSRTAAGSVKELQLGKTTILGTKFRSMLGLNSTNFSFIFDKNSVDIVCKGYGHGVGMSQWGANALGKSGKKYKEILSHYYQQVNIEKY
ncbi:stage II sporulation protein D [Clostridium tetanomorphum]|uniref:Stage II sporulation protein D n=1 Tax=Clostridium tetanomorphum TaxID=1553 RepID=A0A923J1L8_CLOTT|nr:stage II sporulation protein D [Clostridium tetanomorphum]MBC2399371.1 stage II sporulation protein D [Clostridium tetanomorphum]NRZ99405.1 stage II sporulation protein D [Clostridium tetanomorphum]